MESDNRTSKTNTYTYPRKGDSGMIDIQLVMKMFRCGFKSIGGIKVERVLDHSKGADARSEETREIASEVSPEKSSIEYRLFDGSSVVIRPSDAEPKLEVNILIAGDDTENASAEYDTEKVSADESMERASETEKHIREDLENIIYMDNRMGYCCE